MSPYRAPGAPGLPVVEYAYEYDVYREPRTILFPKRSAPPAVADDAGCAPFSHAFRLVERSLYGLCFIVFTYLVTLLAFR